MVGPAGNPPRHQLTEHERRLCLEALLSDRHERRDRRAQQKTGDGVGATAMAAKRTTAAMEVAEAKGDAPARPRAEGKEEASATAAAEAKQTATKKKGAIASRKKKAAAKAVAKPPAASKKKAATKPSATGKKRAAARPPASRMKKKAAKETSGQSSSSTKKKATKEVGDSPAATVGKTQTMQLKPLSVRCSLTSSTLSLLPRTPPRLFGRRYLQSIRHQHRTQVKADTRTIPGITQTSPRHPARRRGKICWCYST
ncbi:hypothetical protein PF003_g10945 [Phytophthora fragariae]|nr:hypothetical protein PF003_g10945 [Phytophthora fragariae]